MLYGQWVGTMECFISLFHERCDNGACSMGGLDREQDTSSALNSSPRLKKMKENRTIMGALMHLFTVCFSSAGTVVQFFKIPLLILLSIVYHEHFSMSFADPCKNQSLLFCLKAAHYR